MKRRIFLYRTVTGAVSATIFTATGWLMGTRTLTMPGPCNPPGYCPPPTTCTENCGELGYTCWSEGCSGSCRAHYNTAVGCNGNGCSCVCEYRGSWGACGTVCPYPCPPN